MQVGSTILRKTYGRKFLGDAIGEGDSVNATTAVMWLRSLLFEMGFGDWVSGPTAMMGDNDQTTNIANEDYISSATRYFRLEYHFCKECKESGDIQPLRVATENNYSDLLTKCLAGPQLEKLRPGLTVMNSCRSHLPLLGTNQCRCYHLQ